MEQADGTAWMALYCQNMFEICVELAAFDPSYDDMAAKFVDHFLWIASAMNHMGPSGMWDEEDGFYYDVLRLPGRQRDAAQTEVDGGFVAALRHHRHRAMAAGARAAHHGYERRTPTAHAGTAG